MRTISGIEVFPLRLPVTATFRFASGSAGTAGDAAPFVLVKVTDSEGASGWGEGRPMPQWSYETLETATTTIRRYLAPALIGMPITDRWDLHWRMQRAIGRGPSTGQPIAKAAVDMAVHDLCARVAGLPLRCYLGGSPERDTIALSYTLTAHEPALVRDDVQTGLSQGFRHVNVKVAVDPATDRAMIAAVREAAGPAAFIWADANQGLAPHDAVSVAQAYATAGVGVLEQPFPADQIHLMRALRPRCPVPLAVDEASVSPADFFQYAAEGLVDYLVVKVTRSGGIWPTLQQIAVAYAAGLPLLVSGLTDGLLTKMAACQVAAAYGYSGPAALNGSQFVDEAALYPGKHEIEWGGSVHLGAQPGIGVEPDPQALERYLVKTMRRNP